MQLISYPVTSQLKMLIPDTTDPPNPQPFVSVSVLATQLLFVQWLHSLDVLPFSEQLQREMPIDGTQSMFNYLLVPPMSVTSSIFSQYEFRNHVQCLIMFWSWEYNGRLSVRYLIVFISVLLGRSQQWKSRVENVDCTGQHESCNLRSQELRPWRGE